MEKGTYRQCIQANIILGKEAKLNHAEFTSISLTMPLRGLDTVTTLVAWSVGLLSQRPDVQEKAGKAIQEMMYGQKEPMCSVDDDHKCVYVTALVKGRLRYNSFPLPEKMGLSSRTPQILHGPSFGSSPDINLRDHLP
ncbi:uncharacterized protein N7459_003705 [Penicillium hispanicum]|uniref:uncharacterized protein n=1 Tax=Penicillium hispanicum TaxID=1080232 RepID=UPI002540EBB4|nr:uncharacterized protein N7459_003705 [Penicillium hispanicum]KAJ5587940.1 hypothetical protein N7459_003705 [Penicillium hispanicum]